MARKTALTSDKIIGFYMDYVLEHNQKPASIYKFAKDNKFEEQDFYQFFGSFETLENSIFEVFFDNTITVLEKSEDYLNFDARNQLLSFYFTFFENLTANRSYVKYVLEGGKDKLKSLKTLKGLKHKFSNYIDTLQIETLDLKEKRLEEIKTKGLQETAWVQFLVTIKFWLDDSSPSFEKTDLFIEKSVKASFDLIDTTPLKSLVDLGKFLFKEKVNS